MGIGKPIKISRTGKEVQNFLAGDTARFSQGLRSEQPTSHIRGVSFQPHIRTPPPHFFIFKPRLANFEEWHVSLDGREFFKNYFFQMTTVSGIVLPLSVVLPESETF